MASFGFGGSNAHAVLDDAANYLQLRRMSAVNRTILLGQASTCTRKMSEIDITPFTDLSSYDSFAESHQAAFGSACRKSTNSLSTCSTVNQHKSRSTDGSNNDNANSHILQTQAWWLIVLSAADEHGIHRLIDAYQPYLVQSEWNRKESDYLDRLAYTLSNRRSSLQWRSFAIASSMKDLKLMKGPFSKPSLASKESNLAFVFTGQGAQYYGMGVELLCYPTFRDAINSFDDILEQIGSDAKVSELLKWTNDDGDIHDPRYAQPATTGLQIALYELLESFGVTPSAVLGHSSGEIAAAYAAGALSLHSACKLSYHRGRLASVLKESHTSPGAMMSVNLPIDEMRIITSRDTRYSNSIHISCVNSPNNVTVSGPQPCIASLKHEMDSQAIACHMLKTGVAYHSPYMEAVTEDYATIIKGLVKGVSKRKRPNMISSVSGTYVRSLDDLCTPNYWVANMVSPVEFSKAMNSMLCSTLSKQTRKLGAAKPHGIREIVEIGPHSALRQPIIDCVNQADIEADVTYMTALRRNEAGLRTLLGLSGELYVRGYPLKVCEVNTTTQRKRVEQPALLDLPSYPFNHSKSYWHESPASKHARRRRAPMHELLGCPVVDWNPSEPRWRKIFDVTETPWIDDHKVNGKAIYPATGMIVMAIEAARQLADPSKTISGYRIRDATFSAPVAISSMGRTEVQLSMLPDSRQSNSLLASFNYCVYTRADEKWFENCRGFVQIQYETFRQKVGSTNKNESKQHYEQKYEATARACTREVESEKMYDAFQRNGLAYGPAFQRLDRLHWDGHNCAVGVVNCFEWTSQQSNYKPQSHVVHPATMDAVGQLIWVALTKGAEKMLFKGLAVTRIRSAWVSNSGLSQPEAFSLRV